MQAQKPYKFKGIGKKLIKSEIYAFLALHALVAEIRELEIIREKIAKNRLERYVRKYAGKTNNQGTLIKAFEAATGKIIERPQARKVSIHLTRNSFTSIYLSPPLLFINQVHLIDVPNGLTVLNCSQCRHS